MARPQALDEPVDLPHVLRRVPRRPLHQLVCGLLAVIRHHVAVAPAARRTEGREPITHALAVLGDRGAVPHRRRWLFEQPGLREMALFPTVDERGAESEDADRPLVGGQDPVEAGAQRFGREPLALDIRDPDELGERFRVPAVNKPIAEMKATLSSWRTSFSRACSTRVASCEPPESSLVSRRDAFPTERGVQHVARAVAEQVQSEHGDHDRETREPRDPRRILKQ